MHHRRLVSALLCACLTWLSGCSQVTALPPTAKATPGAPVTAASTSTPLPTQTPLPTASPVPSLTPTDNPTATPLPVLAGSARLNQLVWSLDGGFLASATSDGAMLLDAGTLKVIARFDKGTWVNDVAFMPMRSGAAPRLITLARSGDMAVWDIDTGKQVVAFHNNAGSDTTFTGLALSPDGRWLAAGGSDAVVRVWNMAAGQLARRLKGLSGAVTSLAFSPDSRTLAAGAQTDCAANVVIAAWDIATGAPREAPSAVPSTVNAVAYSPDGKVLASAGADGVVNLRPLAGGDGLDLYAHSAEITTLAYSPDGKEIASGGADHAVFVWDTVSGQQISDLQGHGDTVTGLAYQPGTDQLISGSADGDVRLWQPEAGQLLLRLMLFSPLNTQITACQ